MTLDPEVLNSGTSPNVASYSCFCPQKEKRKFPPKTPKVVEARYNFCPQKQRESFHVPKTLKVVARYSFWPPKQDNANATIFFLVLSSKFSWPPEHRTSSEVAWVTGDYHIPPVLPPKVNCSCLAAMDAYASLLSVASATPTPGAPVTLDPEVLNSGTSKIIATLRMYQDPTYTIPATSLVPLPVVVVRFFLELSTKFTRNKITITDCSASSLEVHLNDTGALKPRRNTCDNSTFDTKPERGPAGVTHMERLSMKKFKFQHSEMVYIQCKIRACAQQPCGECTGEGDDRRALLDELSPVEGEMFAPPAAVLFWSHGGRADHFVPQKFLG